MRIDAHTPIRKIIDRYPSTIDILERKGVNVSLSSAIASEVLDVCLRYKLDLQLLLSDLREHLQDTSRKSDVYGGTSEWTEYLGALPEGTSVDTLSGLGEEEGGQVSVDDDGAAISDFLEKVPG
jgi:hypothetical protein